MKGLQIFALLLMLGILTIVASTAESQKEAIEKQTNDFKTWEIHSESSGGRVGDSSSYSLNSDGNLEQSSRSQEQSPRSKETKTKIAKSKIQEIGKMLHDLNLPGANVKTVKGKHYNDGVYGGFTITLDKTKYNVSGQSWYDSKYVVLTVKQQEMLDKLKKNLPH